MTFIRIVIPALAYCWSMILSEHRYPPGITSGRLFRDHALAAMPTSAVRRFIASVPAKHVVTGNLLGRQQRPLSQMRFQMNDPEVALQDRDRVDLGSKHRRVNSAIRKGPIESP